VIVDQPVSLREKHQNLMLRKVIRRLLLGFVLGGHELFRVGISREQIEKLLNDLNRTHAELTLRGEDAAAKGPENEER
jgi:hypothetical protein